ncbi:MAG: ATP phosphoribosyltransferase regulatory subunit [Rhizobiaceae bacterium]
MTDHADILALFSARGAGAIDVPVLQPADPFLDMAGEDLRRRIFLTESETGAQLCLRPEFTIPVCLDHIAKRASTPRRYSYLGEVFRQRREGGNEFLQAGIEDLGEPDRAEADARSIADAHALFRLTLPRTSLAFVIGDQAVFEAVLAALGLPRGWRMRLARAFGAPDALSAALADLASPPRAAPLDPALEPLAIAGDEAALTARIEADFAASGLSPAAGRAPHEVARRLVEKTALSRVRLPEAALAALKRFLAIRVPVDRAAAELAGFAASAKLDLGAALAGFTQRAEAMQRHGLPVGDIVYDAAFGRPLDYYTGLVFEISVAGAARPLAGGGRYDRLLTLLGAETPIPGVGFSVWLDRVEQARSEA